MRFLSALPSRALIFKHRFTCEAWVGNFFIPAFWNKVSKQILIKIWQYLSRLIWLPNLKVTWKLDFSLKLARQLVPYFFQNNSGLSVQKWFQRFFISFVLLKKRKVALFIFKNLMKLTEISSISQKKTLDFKNLKETWTRSSIFYRLFQGKIIKMARSTHIPWALKMPHGCQVWKRCFAKEMFN